MSKQLEEVMSHSERVTCLRLVMIVFLFIVLMIACIPFVSKITPYASMLCFTTAFASIFFFFPIGCDTKRATWFDLVAAVFLLILLITAAITIFGKVPLRSVILSFAASTYVMVSASLIACKKEKWFLIIHGPIMLYAVVMFYVNILRLWNLE